ncbi:MAG: calcium-binding protein [Maritimibacter sp.]|nr:calcium-binding protein [Maritimibacter sp.]
MARILVPHGGTVRGGQVFDHHFGVNFISNKDEAPDGGALQAYQDAVNDLASGGPVSVRFPGGGVAENGDFTVLDDGAVLPGTHTWEFLEDAAANGWSVTIVLPTWRFLDLGSMTMDTATAAAEVETFARSLLAAATNLGVTIDGFEIGNEFDLMAEKTNGAAQLTGAEAQAFSDAYAAIAATMTRVLDAEIDAAGLDAAGDGDAPWIGVQALWSWIPDTWRKAQDFRDTLADAFDAEGAADAVDALIAHIYPWLELEANPQDWLTGETHIIDTLTATEAVFGGGLDWVVSEWEVSFGAGDAIETMKDHYDGIKQLEPVVALFTQMVAAGIDAMNLWPVRNGAFTSLETLNGEEKPLSYLFDMMSDQLPGLEVLDLNGKAPGVMWEAGDDIHVYGYEGDGRAVFYLGSRSDETRTLDLDFSAWRGRGRAPTVEVSWISVDDPEAKGYQQGTAIGTRAYSWAGFHADAAEILTFSPYEMIVVELVYRAGAGKTEIGTERHDLLFGSTGEDVLEGRGGADWIYGRLGADFIDAGDGDDLIWGGRHGDLILAGDGDDVVDGGLGQDIVELGAGADVFRDNGQRRFYGNDTIDGGDGDDTIQAGLGDDLITGGAGADVFDFGTVSQDIDEDTITDFQPGVDLLRIDGVDYATIEALVAAFAVYSDGTDTMVHLGARGWITLQGIDASGVAGVAPPPEGMRVSGSRRADRELDGTPFGAEIYGRGGRDSLYGRGGDDLLDGGNGSDWLHGGSGDDLLVDGRGYDRLYGGDGADRFQLGRDGQTDRIYDFEQGRDVIDLAAWGLDGFADLAVGAADGGWTELRAGDERLLLRAAGGDAINLAADDFLF